ncbi:MAG: threonine/serine dehydratase [Gemmatimonadaceae bacterium]
MPVPLPSPISVFAAARRLHGVVRHAPLTRSAALSAIAGGDVYLKRENEQVTGSFKVRGAYNVLATLGADERERGVVASSAGNHGLGVAYAADRLGVRATIFVPTSAPAVKRDGIRKLGAIVDDSQPDYDAAMALATRRARERGARFINPCLGDELLAGQGTVALEVATDLPQLASIVVPVGGGGLLGGVGGFLRPVAPQVRIAGAQSVATAAMARSLAAGRVVEIPSVPTLADGLAGQIDEEALAIGRAALDEMVTLTEEEIAATIAFLAREEGMVVEGSGAVAAGALLHRKLAALATPAVVIVSGGNIDPARHEELLRGTRTAARGGAPPPGR